MPPVNDKSARGGTGQQYWRSLEHLADTDEFRAFMHREFPAGASEMLDSSDRRHFLKIMGASMALAGLGLAGCRRWPSEEIAPYASRPEGRDPGTAVQYATCMELAGVSRGLLVTSYDGRPVKIEGNPDHPASLGSADRLDQASVLDLYDPDRSRGVMTGRGKAQSASSFDAFAAWAGPHFAELGRRQGTGLAVLSEASASPSVKAMKRRLAQTHPQAKWHEYEALNNDNEVEGASLAFGAPHRVQFDLGAARYIVALDADFLGAHRDGVRNIRGFAAGRAGADDDKSMNRLYVFEGDFSLTGANADARCAVRSAHIAVIAAYLAARILGEESLKRFEEDGEAVLSASVRAELDHALEDLQSHHGHGLIVAGPRQPAEVHLLVHLMNEALGNVGHTVAYTPQADAVKHVESLRALAADIEAGRVSTLLILGGNPVYNAPADLDFAALLGRVETVIHLADYDDETSVRCDWHVNRAHYLESWGDGRAWDGTYSVCQPLIEPLWGGKSAIELLALVTGDDLSDGRSIVQRTFSAMIGGESEARWRRTLHDGVLRGSAYTNETPGASRSHLAPAIETLHGRWSGSTEGWELVFAEHTTIFDGRFANNGWLQELPDPMTKLTWDNAVIISPRSARGLGVSDGDMVTVSVNGRTIDTAVMRLPGLPDRSATLQLGFGRTFSGRICTGAGFDFGSLRTSDSMGFAGGATIAKTGGSYVLATTQDHHTIDVETVGGKGVQDRLPTLLREGDLNEYREHPQFAKHRAHVVHRLSLWDENLPHHGKGGDYAWGLSIDLNSCVGCNACIVACQAENNIPIVGKDQVNRHREMHWLRVDRYFKFEPTGDDGHGKPTGWDPDRVTATALQPVPCMHCENAPCEQVCPVAATVHDGDGLNVMVYNRCIGTRYCSNNCPYKVRKFNYFDYHRRKPHRETGLAHVEKDYYTKGSATPDELKQMQFNPDVTVRMRGVMEKCTYCIQRIAAARIEAKNEFVQLSVEGKEAKGDERIAVPDGSVTTACAQTCPAQAIVFGDLNDPNSRIAKMHAHDRSYEMLEELNVKARTKYLARLRNPFGGGSAGGDDGHGGGHAEDADH